jgi:hypothetical protein
MLVPLLAVPGVVRTGEAELAKYQEMRKKYLEKIQSLGRPSHDAYQKKLAEFERSLVERRKYEMAAKVREERESLAIEMGLPVPSRAAELPPAGSSTLQEDGTVVMEGKDAAVEGGVTRDEAAGKLDGWKTAEAVARWLLPKGLKTGGYEVELTYACAGGNGGVLHLKEDFFALTRTIQESGSWESFRTEVIGTLRIREGSRQLQLAAQKVEGEKLFVLKTVRLLPSNRPS